MIKNKVFYAILLIGIFLRVGMAVTTYHSDLGAFALAGKYIAGEGKWFSFYDQVFPSLKTEKLFICLTKQFLIINLWPIFCHHFYIYRFGE